MESGILSDLEIQRAIKTGDIEIDPFTPEQLNITSYDLTLGDEVKVYKRWVWDVSVHTHSVIPGSNLHSRDGVILDAKEEPETYAWRMNPERGFLLKPNIGYLMHTRERVHTDRYNPILDGKSSIGRLFIQVHSTAGYIDPGFSGQYTLEIIVRHPVLVYPGMRVAQVRFHTIAGQLGKLYNQVGHYTDAAATGAVASQAWRQFKR